MKSALLVIVLFALAFAGFFYLDKIVVPQSEQPASSTPSESPLSLQALNDAYDQLGSDRPGLYLQYSPELVAGAGGNKKLVLYFNASWCPTCISADRAFVNNADRIPSDVIVMSVDYDTQTELKRRYNITYQHTFVQIDQNGNQIARWSGGALDSLLANIK